jgi:PAS domain S-box-containing protein
MLLLGAAYFLAGKAGLLVAVGNASVSVVWPPTGIAIAALLLWGAELWPAVFVGAFLVNLTTTGDPASSLGIAAGNSLEALVGAYLAQRFAGGRDLLSRPQTVIAFALLAGFLAATVAASIGTLSLVLSHLAPAAGALDVWGRWWLGDAIGAIEFTPLVLALFQRASEPHPVLPTPRWAEALLMGVGVVAVSLLVFGRGSTGLVAGYPLVFLVLPPTIWAGIRFGPLGATASASAVSLVAVVTTVLGRGPFASLAPDVALLTLRIFIGSLVLTALLVVAEVTQHQRLERALYHARKELQRMLQARTVELDAAKSLAKIGTWTYDVETRKVVWSEEMYRILGYGEQRFPVVLEQALERVVPEDRDAILKDLGFGVRSADGPADPFPERRIRVQLPDGEHRTVESRMQRVVAADGHTTRISGTILDVTELQRVEEELRALRGGTESPEGTKQGFLLWMVPWAKRRSE